MAVGACGALELRRLAPDGLACGERCYGTGARKDTQRAAPHPPHRRPPVNVLAQLPTQRCQEYHLVSGALVRLTGPLSGLQSDVAAHPHTSSPSCLHPTQVPITFRLPSRLILYLIAISKLSHPGSSLRTLSHYPSHVAFHLTAVFTLTFTSLNSIGKNPI